MSSNHQLASLELAYEVEQFYYLEARLMNQRRHREWLETMIHPDIHYWLPIIENRFLNDKRPAPTPDDGGIFNDDYAALDQRVRRLETGLVWMEDPPSRLRHLITNVEVHHTDDPNRYEVFSNFHIYRNRRERDETNLIGGREDLLQREHGALKILKRKIILDMRVVLDKNLYLFM